MKLSFTRHELEQALICYANKRGNVVDPAKATFVITGQTAIIDLDYAEDQERAQKARELAEAMEIQDDKLGINNLPEAGSCAAPMNAHAEEMATVIDEPTVEEVADTIEEPIETDDNPVGVEPVGFAAPKGFS